VATRCRFEAIHVISKGSPSGGSIASFANYSTSFGKHESSSTKLDSPKSLRWYKNAAEIKLRFVFVLSVASFAFPLQSSSATDCQLQAANWAIMLCSACQDIFKKPGFLYGTQSDNKLHKHTTNTQSVREAALINGCQICAVLCFHFDEDSPEKRPRTELDLKYRIELFDKNNKIAFFYRNCLDKLTVQNLRIIDENGLSFIFNIPLPNRMDLTPT
jgi:hypothetical protein